MTTVEECTLEVSRADHENFFITWPKVYLIKFDPFNDELNSRIFAVPQRHKYLRASVERRTQENMQSLVQCDDKLILTHT